MTTPEALMICLIAGITHLAAFGIGWCLRKTQQPVEVYVPIYLHHWRTADEGDEWKLGSPPEED